MSCLASKAIVVFSAFNLIKFILKIYISLVYNIYLKIVGC